MRDSIQSRFGSVKPSPATLIRVATDGFESLPSVKIKTPTTFMVGVLMAEEKGFEPLRRFHALRDFESRLFDQLEYSSIAWVIITAGKKKIKC